MIKKSITFSIILLFIGVSVSSAINIQNVSTKEEYTEKDVRELLFETIVDVVNNPEVKQLVKDNEYQIRIKDGNYQNIIRKILFRSPALLSSIFILRQGITIDSLNKLYDIGLKLYKVLDEDELLQLKNSIEVKSQCDCGEIDDIELQYKFAQFENDLICDIIGSIITVYAVSILVPFELIIEIFQDIPFIYDMLINLYLVTIRVPFDTLCNLHQDTYNCPWHLFCGPNMNL